MNMIKKTRYKFIGITLGAISLVLIFILGTLNIGIFCVTLYNAKTSIEELKQRRGFVFSGPFTDFLPGGENDSYISMSDLQEKTSYMYVKINRNNPENPLITTNMNDNYSADEIYYIASTLAKRGIANGIYNNMVYDITDDGLSVVIVIIDISGDLGFLKNIFNLDVLIIALSLVVVFIFTYYFSKWAIKPVQNAFEAQRRFISDASHELKTPLATINANTDVLESEIGENKWLTNIKNQTNSMTELVYDLLNLAKLDETGDSAVLNEFDLSSLVLGKTLEFESIAFENNRTFEENIKEGVKFKGNEDSIGHLVSILIDNAIKHSNENGTVRVTLTTSGNKKVFQVYNTGNGIREDEKDKIFDRFYRSDESRSKKTGGSGLGLAIAKSIADAHNGTITVDGEYGKWVSFTVIL